MKAICRSNQISDQSALSRLRNDFHIEGPISELTIGEVYSIQALEFRGSGVWFFIHSIDALNWPTPYPGELFQMVDPSLPAGWCLAFKDDRGPMRIARISFCEWASDDSFFEKLVDGDAEALRVYREHRES